MPSLEDLENTLKSKAALDAIEALRVYQELIESGWPHDKAFQVAFLGVQLIFIPGMKPVPEPDPPFSLPALYRRSKKPILMFLA